TATSNLTSIKCHSGRESFSDDGRRVLGRALAEKDSRPLPAIATGLGDNDEACSGLLLRNHLPNLKLACGGIRLTVDFHIG
ncbi:MAG: hypothetical protein QGF59_18050, partial [Pirellulaceae bacterium]|nr:hypothetical protein [Pirellulaceae bacterium]